MTKVQTKQVTLRLEKERKKQLGLSRCSPLGNDVKRSQFMKRLCDICLLFEKALLKYVAK